MNLISNELPRLNSFFIERGIPPVQAKVKAPLHPIEAACERIEELKRQGGNEEEIFELECWIHDELGDNETVEWDWPEQERFMC